MGGSTPAVLAARTWEHGKGRFHLLGDQTGQGQLDYYPRCGTACTLDLRGNDPVSADTVPCADRCSRCAKLGWPATTETERQGCRLRYVSNGDVVVLEVPWGPGSEMIPPPSLAFSERVFFYGGEE